MTDSYDYSAHLYCEDAKMYSNLAHDATPSFAQIYKEGIEFFGKRSYKLVPHLSCHAGFHRVYQLVSPPAIQGITFPEWFKYWREVLAANEVMQFQSHVKALIHQDPDHYKDWSPLLTCDQSKSTPLYKHTKLLVANKPFMETMNEPAELGIEFNPQEHLGADLGFWKGYPRAFIPLASWFSADIQKQAIENVATLWPTAEQELLSMFVGRVVVGPNNSVTPSGYKVKHNFQGCALTFSEDTGLGRSTFYNALFGALSMVGYKVETFGDINSRYNMGPIVSADIIYKDDITLQPLKKFVRSETAKAIIKGHGVIRTKDKWVEAVDMRPNGVVFINIDEYDPQAYGVDQSTAGLFKVIATHRQFALDRLEVCGSPSAYPEFHLPYLAKQCGASKKALMLWFARLCADKFLESIKPKP